MIITAINYLNTVPMIYGMEHGGITPQVSIAIAPPSKCADAAIEGITDIALVPVAEVPRIIGARVITDFCISADGAVDTVALLSNCSLHEITTIHLDWHSRTSVQLVRVLARELWGKPHIEWVDIAGGDMPRANDLPMGHAMLAIGDKVFDIQSDFTFKTDLASEWKRLTGLPFVFAVWVAVTPQGEAFEGQLNRALEFGVSNIADAIAASKRKYEPQMAYRYLTENIKFRLSSSGRKAIELFWEKIITPG